MIGKMQPGKSAGASPNILGDRMRQSREDLGLSIDAMSARLAVNKNTLGAYERGERLPDIDYLIKYAHVVGDDILTLLETRIKLSGEEGADAAYGVFMAVADRLESMDQLQAQSPIMGYNMPGDYADYVFIPLYDVGASAGHGNWNDTERITARLAFMRTWVRNKLKANPDMLALINVDGDSMEPTLNSGDIILINLEQKTFDKEGIYVLMMNGRLIVKRLQGLPDHMVNVVSDNLNYPNIMLHDSFDDADEYIIGKVLWAARKF